jgi:hypothetical protein
MKSTRDTRTDALEAFFGSNMKYIYVFSIYAASLLLFAYFAPSLLRQDIFTNDMAEWTSWAYSYRDAELFQNDVNKNYWMANFPPGYRAVFAVLSPLIDPELLGKFLGLALGALTTFLSYALGRQITGGKTWGGIANLIFVPICQFTSFSPILFFGREVGGLPRAFALPIMLFGIISALRRDMRLLGGAMLLGALFYPPTCIMLGAYTALIVFNRIIREKAVPAGTLAWISLTVVAGVILVFSKSLADPSTGPLYSYEQMLHMPEFWPNGVAGYFFHTNWWEYVADLFQMDHGITSVAWLSLLGAAFYVGVINNNRNLIRAEVLFIPLSAAANYILAYIVLLRLFEPSRYLMYPLQALTLCCVPFIFENALIWSTPWLARLGASRIMDMRVRAIGLVVVTIIGLGIFSARVVYNRGGPDTMPSEIYAFLGTLPKDAVIAATPTDGDRVPMRSHRSALLIGGSLFPYHPKYYEEMKKRFVAVLATMYDGGPEAVQELRRKYGVRYFILNRNSSRPDPWAELKPFKDYRLDFQSNNRDRQPYILSLANSATVFHKDDYSVLDLERMGSLP